MKKNLDTEKDNRWRTKGHIHENKKKLDGIICPFCCGEGMFEINNKYETLCEYCGRLGVIK